MFRGLSQKLVLGKLNISWKMRGGDKKEEGEEGRRRNENKLSFKAFGKRVFL